MNVYLKNLTDNLIGKHRLYELWAGVKKDTQPRKESDFIDHVARMLVANDLNTSFSGGMKPETLGIIAMSFEKDDITLATHAVFADIDCAQGRFVDFAEFVRFQIAVALALVITDRLAARLKPAYQVPKNKKK